MSTLVQRVADALDQSGAQVKKKTHHNDTENFVPRIVGTCLADVEPEQVQWLWPGRIPFGKLTLLTGNPGLGKSFILLDCAAKLSTGALWPDAQENTTGASCTVILTAEDGLADTIRPRLDAAGADVKRVFCVEGVMRTEDGEESHLDLSDDLRTLERYIEQHEARFVIIDPITAYLGGRDSNSNSDMRGLLGPLASLAERQRCAVVAITHLNKAAGMSALNRSIGSVAFGAQARMAWLVTQDPENPESRLFLPLKGNITKPARGMSFAIVASDIPEVGRVAWSADPVDRDAEEVLGAVAGGRHTEVADAADWLVETLAGGPVPSTTLLADAKENGHHEKTLRRAAAKLGIKPRKQSFGGGWVWALPSEDGHEDSQGGQSQSVATLGEVGHLGDGNGKAGSSPSGDTASGLTPDRSAILVLRDRMGRTDDPGRRAALQAEIDAIQAGLAKG